MKISRIFLVLIALTSVLISQGTPKAMLNAIKISDPSFIKAGDNLVVSFSADLSAVELGKNNQIIYTPVVVSQNDENMKAVLPPFVVNGRNVAIREQREPATRIADALYTFTAWGDTPGTINYTYNIPYQSWMDLSALYLSEDLCGCGDIMGSDSRQLYSFDNMPAPEAIAIFVEPQVEEVKAREEKGSAYIDFVVNTVDIRPGYRKNPVELKKIIASIDLVRNDANVSIDEINIHGYASPEGTYKRNTWLAENRAISLTDYVKSLYDIPSSVFTTDFTPEDWGGFRRMLLESDIENRDGILAIIDSDLEPDAKDAKIKRDYPATYQYILKEWYPALRHSDYIIRYTVRPFTVEESLAMLDVNPGQVSLNEMFMVAQTFTPGTPEYNRVMEIAVSTYPNNPVANYNAGIAALNAGDYATASRYLDKANADAATLNARGIIALNSGDLDTAEKYFRQALDAGSTEAKGNLDIVARQRKLALQNR